jgi:hypothetical protein
VDPDECDQPNSKPALLSRRGPGATDSPRAESKDQLQKCRRINKRRLMSQRRLTRQQVVGDAGPLLDCAGHYMEDELRVE